MSTRPAARSEEWHDSPRRTGSVRRWALRGGGMNPPAILRTPRGRWHDDVVEWAQAATIVSALAAFTGLQALWISRALERVHATLDRLDATLDRVEGVVLRDHGERIARLETARSA